MKQLFVLIAAATILGTLLAATAEFFWLGELASHFPVQALCAAFIALPVLARDRRYGWLVLLTLAAGINAFKLLPYLDQSGVGPPGIEVVTINLQGSNQDFEKVIGWLGEARPAVVALVEFNEYWAREFEALHEVYPYRESHPAPDNFGIAILSRLPIVSARAFALAGLTPAVEADIDFGPRTVTAIALHLRPPITPRDTAGRNAQLQALAELAQRRRQPLILLGDFNSTPFSPKLKRLLTESGMADAAAGRGIGYTWPRAVPWFRIPIDLCLVSPEFRVNNQHLGPDIGSDHWPLVTDLTL